MQSRSQGAISYVSAEVDAAFDWQARLGANMDAVVDAHEGKAEIIGSNLNVERQIRDALSLADFAVASGFTSADGTLIPPEIISTIQTAATDLGFYN